MEILRQPDSLSLLGNLKEFLISSQENVTFTLSTEIDGVATTLLTESYIPDAFGRITIDVKEVCRQYLKTELPGDNVVAQDNAARTFTATIGATSVTFRVVNASVRNLALTPADYLEYNFLTLQPQTKKVSWHSPEYLSYYFVGVAYIKAKFYLVSGGTETVTVASITPEVDPGEIENGGTIRLVNKVYTVNTTLSRLMALSSHSTDELQGIVDVWVEQLGERKSYIQRYVYAPATGDEHHYLAVNSLGGIDTFTFHGEQKISGEIEHQVAENNDLKISVTQDGQRKYRQTTGYLGVQEAEWLWEFLHSNQQWVVADGTAEAIALQSSSLSQGDITALNSSSFDFVLAREGGLLPESRRDETFPDITVPSPVSDLFFLTPRLIDFEAASEESELVFPVQTPYSNVWKYLTLSALQERLSLSVIPDHTHGNLSVLNELGEVDGHLTYRGSVIGSGNGITLPIAISDVDGLRTVLNSKANSNHTHRWTDISDRPLRLSDFTNDILSSWALAATKPDYTWSEILNKPTTLSGFGITDGYSSFSTTGSGNAITGVSGSGHALTFTKGNTFVDLASEQTISGKKHISYLDVTGALAIPQVEPTAESGKVFEYIDNSGSFGESASAVTPADLKDLVLKVNGVTVTTYNPASAASFNVDLTDYATQSWVEAKNYLQGITKAMVEAVLTGNITSHTHSQYLTSHQSLANYYTKTQADAKFLTEHQSLEDYALKSEIPTSMAWSAITGRPSKLSDFTNDLISSWALAATKPSYSWNEIGSRPTALSDFSSDSTHRLVTDTQITNWNAAYGWGDHSQAGYLTSSDLSGYATEQYVDEELGYYLPLNGGRMTGKIVLGTGAEYGLKTDTSWTDAYRIVPFSTTSNNSISLYYDNATKGLMYNPNTGYVRAAGYVVNGQTGFLKANGSVDTNSYVPYSTIFNTINSHDNRKLWLYEVHNAFWAASYRYDVTMTGFTSGNALALFNGSFDDQCKIAPETTAVITIAGKNGSTMFDGGYPYGYLEVSFYYIAVPESISCRMCKVVSGEEVWTNVSMSNVNRNSGYATYRGTNNNIYGVTKIEITIVGKSNSTSYNYTAVSEIAYYQNRGTLGQCAVFNKSIAQTLYYNLGFNTSKGNTGLRHQDASGTWRDWLMTTDAGAVTLSSASGQNLSLNGLLLSSAGELSCHLFPSSTNTRDIGSSTKKFKDAYLAGNLYSDTLFGKLDWSYIQNKPSTLSGFGITDGYSSFSTTGSGNAITGVSGSGHALTFTKGNTFVDLANEQTISGKKHISYLDVTGALAIPQVEPTSESGKVFEYIDNSGSFGEVASAVTPADLKDLVLKVNGVTVTTYNPAAAASFNVDLTAYATQSWVEAKNYLQGITKAMVEAVLTGNITSHTHSQYLTSHQSLSGYATQSWVQQQGYLTSHQSLSNYYTKTQADAKFLTEHQSLENYALKSEIPTSMAWTAITGRPTKLSDFTNDIISSWALAATKPSYSWSEIGSKPTSLSGYGISDATSKTEAIPYIVGPSTDTTAGTWTGTYEGITAYTDGLTIIYVPAVAGASTTTLNINGLGAKTCYFSNTSKLTTHYSAGTPILFTYRGGYWRRADYNTNSDTLLRVYRQTSGYNDDYPILVSRTKSIGTVGSNSSYTAVYGVVHDTTQQPTVNPNTGELKAIKVTATTLQGSLAWSYISGKPTSLSDFTNDMISSWALAASKPAYNLDEVSDGSTRKLSDYMLSSSFTKSAITTLLGNDTFAPYNSNGYLPLNGGTLTGELLLQANQTFDVSTAARSIYYTDSNNVSRRAMIMNPNGVLAIGYDLPSAQLNLQLDGYSTLLRFGSTKNYSLTLNGADGTIRSSVGANLVSLGYRSGNTIYPFKHIYSTFNVSTKCIGAISGTVLYGVARFTIANTKKARTFAIKIPSGTNATTFKIIIYSSYNTCPSSTITVSTGGVNLTSSVYCALYPSYSVEGSFAGRVAFARDGNTSDSNMYILLGCYNDGQQYQSGMIAIDSIIHSSGASVADTVMNFGYELLDLDSESMFTKITECVNADAHFKSVSVTEHVTAPKIDCTNMFLVPTSEPSSVPAGKVAEYIDLTGGSFAN